MNIMPFLLALSMTAAPAGHIAFVEGTHQEDQCVALIDLKTGEIERIGPGQRDGAPRWSPDGQWLAFESQTPGGLGICVLRVDGGDHRMLAHQYSWNHSPRWSPDGTRLAYNADVGQGLAQAVVVYDLESNTETVWGALPDTSETEADSGEAPPADKDAGPLKPFGLLRPVWLPSTELMKAMHPEDERLTADGVDIAALEEEAEASGALMAIGLIGRPGASSTEPFLITPSHMLPLLPLIVDDSLRYAEWSIEPGHRGRRIAFETNDGGFREIFMLDRRGLTDVSNHRAADWNPVWSPDDKWIAFESFRSGRRGVYRLFPDTARVFPVAVAEEYDCWAPAWSPGSDWLAYLSMASGNPQIHLFDIEGSADRTLTDGPGYALAPAWRPKVKP